MTLNSNLQEQLVARYPLYGANNQVLHRQFVPTFFVTLLETKGNKAAIKMSLSSFMNMLLNFMHIISMLSNTLKIYYNLEERNEELIRGK